MKTNIVNYFNGLQKTGGKGGLHIGQVTAFSLGSTHFLQVFILPIGKKQDEVVSAAFAL